jgi:hypothetical protein
VESDGPKTPNASHQSKLPRNAKAGGEVMRESAVIVSAVVGAAFGYYFIGGGQGTPAEIVENRTCSPGTPTPCSG